jgi:hypothetical protein
LALCSVNTGAFKAYDLGSEWQLGGFAVPAASAYSRSPGFLRVTSYSSPFWLLQAEC